MTKVHIAGVGHTGKDESRGERGSNARKGDVDLEVTINGDTATRVATVTKANDQNLGPLTSYTTEKVTLGFDEDDDEIYTYIVDPQNIPAAAIKKTGRPKGSPQAQLALSALQLASAECGAAPPSSNHIPNNVRTINLALWKDYFLRRTVAGQERTESGDRAFRRAVDRLQANGFIGIWGDQVWLASQ